MPDPNQAPPTDPPVSGCLRTVSVSALGNILDEIVAHPLHDHLLPVRRAGMPMSQTLSLTLPELLRHE